jgi:hypothetical protein
MRRSSVHERRDSISAKDARDEGLRLHELIAAHAMATVPDDDDDDDDDAQILDAITVTSPTHFTPPSITVTEVRACACVSVCATALASPLSSTSMVNVVVVGDGRRLLG